MTTGPQPAPILDDEFLLRRMPKHLRWYHPGQNPIVDEQAFRPTDQDLTGISLERLQSAEHPEFKSIEEAAQGPNPNGYWVAVLSVRELRSHGVRIEPRVQNAGPGHVELPDLNTGNRKDNAAIELKRLLSLKVIRVEDPASLSQ